MRAIFGKYTVVHAPGIDRALAEHLVRLGDAAVERYQELLDLPPPHTRLHATLCAPEIYPAWVARWYEKNLPLDGRWAFASRERGACVRILPLAWGPNDETIGFQEVAYLHELAHAYQQDRIAAYHDQPKWLLEGIAGELTVRALSPDGNLSIPELLMYSGLIGDADDALQKKRMSLDSVVALGPREWHDTRRTEPDALAFAVVHQLFREAPFRAFVQELSRASGPFLTWQTNHEFTRRFGPLDAIAAKLKRALPSEQRSSWTTSGLYLRLDENGDLSAVVRNPTAAAAIHQVLKRTFHLELDVRLTDHADFVDLLVGICEDLRVVGVRADRWGTTRLFAWDVEKPLALAALDPRRSTFEGSFSHHFAVETHSDRITVTIDGDPALDAPVPCRYFGGGWGFHLEQGGVELRGPTMTDATSTN